MWHTHISQEAIMVKKKRKRKDTRSVKDTRFYMVVQCQNIYALCVNTLGRGDVHKYVLYMCARRGGLHRD